MGSGDGGSMSVGVGSEVSKPCSTPRVECFKFVVQDVSLQLPGPPAFLYSAIMDSNSLEA